MIPGSPLLLLVGYLASFGVAVVFDSTATVLVPPSVFGASSFVSPTAAAGSEDGTSTITFGRRLSSL
uniref:Putative secreted peptide n=1 Tax=Anopheles braziliensis TaxID=58242 RepID=A0A2M3ZRA3_9DIPT